MRLYLSSFGFGNHAGELRTLLRGKSRAAVVLNAKDASSEESRKRSLEEEIAALKDLGLQPVELDLRQYFDQPGRIRDVLAAFDLIWIRGGNLFVLRRALRQSGADEALIELLEQDRLVYGGFSAAACVMAPSLSGYETVDDPIVAPSGYDASTVWEGLGLLPYAIAPHYRSDHPESPAIERLVGRFIDDRTLFRTLRDGEAIVIDGARHELMAGEKR